MIDITANMTLAIEPVVYVHPRRGVAGIGLHETTVTPPLTWSWQVDRNGVSDTWRRPDDVPVIFLSAPLTLAIPYFRAVSCPTIGRPNDRTAFVGNDLNGVSPRRDS